MSLKPLPFFFHRQCHLVSMKKGYEPFFMVLFLVELLDQRLSFNLVISAW